MYICAYNLTMIKTLKTIYGPLDPTRPACSSALSSPPWLNRFILTMNLFTLSTLCPDDEGGMRFLQARDVIHQARVCHTLHAIKNECCEKRRDMTNAKTKLAMCS